MAGTRTGYDPKSVVTTEEKEVTRGGVTTTTTVRTSTVRNKIQMVDESGNNVVDSEGNPVTYEQTFSMVNDPDASMMKFTVGQGTDKKELASIIKTNVGGEDKYFLKISEAVLANLPEEVKDDIVMVGDQAMLAIDPVEKDGKTIPPVEIDASTGEMKVHIQAKDGGISYTCNFSATGIKIEYDGKTSDYKPKDSAGNRQIIDVEMSTAAFEDMCRMNSGMFSMQGAKAEVGKEMLSVEEIPAFMLGTYVEAMNPFLTKEGDPEAESGFETVTIAVTPGSPNAQDLNIGIARFPTSTPGHPKDHYMVQNSQVNAKGYRKLFYLQNGKFQENTKLKRHFYRCKTDASGTKMMSAEFVVRIKSDDRKIDLAVKPDGSDVTDEVAAVLRAMESFTGVNPVSVQEDRTKFAAASSGIEFDASDPSEPEAIDSTVKGHTIEEEEEKEKDPPPPPPPSKPKKPEFEKKEVKPPKFTQVPGQAAMVAGLFLILASVLLGPIGMAIMCTLGAAMFVGGGLYCANVDKFNNPYDHVTRYIIKPYKSKDLETEQGVEAVYEQDQTRAKADAEYQSAVEKVAESDFMKVFEAFGSEATAMAAQFMSEDNLDKREDFLSAMHEYLDTPFEDTPEGRAKADEARTRIIQTYFRTPHDPMFEGAQLDELKAKLFNNKTPQSVSEITALTETQRARVDAREAVTEAIVNSNDAQFARMLNNPARSAEHNTAFIEQNADAIARRVVTQNLSDEQMRAFNASLPTDAARTAVADAMTRMKTSAAEADVFAEQQHTDAETVANYGTYRETTTALTEKAAAEVAGPDTRPAGFVDYVPEGTAATAAMQNVTARELQAAQEYFVSGLESEHIPADDTIAVAIGGAASAANRTISSATAVRNAHLETAGFFAESLDTPRNGDMAQQIEAARREEAMRIYRETNPVAARAVTDATPTDDIVSKIPAAKRSSKLNYLGNALTKQNEITTAASTTYTLNDVTAQLRTAAVYTVTDWTVQRNVTESLMKPEERAKLDAITDPAKREEVLDFVAAAKTANPSRTPSELIDLATSGAVERLTQASASAGDVSEATRQATSATVINTNAQISARQSQEQLLAGLTKQQRKAVKAKVREKVAGGATENFKTLQEAVTEVVGAQTLPDGRTYDTLHRGGVTEEQVRSNFTREAGYRRKALSRKLGAQQVERIEADHMDTTANEEAAAYVRNRDKNASQVVRYENYAESIFRIVENSRAIARDDLTKAPADRVGQRILTSDDVSDKTNAFLHAVSAAKTQELIAGLGLPAGDPMLTAIQHNAKANDTSAPAGKKLKQLLSKRDRLLSDPDIDLFNKANDEITAAHGLDATSEPAKTTIEARLDAALKDELIAYLGSKGVPDLLTRTTAELLAELNKPGVGGAPAGSRLSKLVEAQKLQDEIDGKGISKAADMEALTSQMELDGGSTPIDAALQAQVDAAVDADTALTAGMTNPADIAAKKAAAKKMIARYMQNGGTLSPAQILANLNNGTYSVASKLAKREVAQEGAPAEAAATTDLKNTLNTYDNQFKDMLELLTPEQRKAVKSKKPKTWFEMRKAVEEVLGGEKLADGKTFEEARAAGVTGSALQVINGRVDAQAREKLERRMGKAAAQKLIERIERHEQEEAAKKLQEEEAERTLVRELRELEKEIAAAEAMTDKKAQKAAFKKIREKCKDDKYQRLFKKKKQKSITKVKESITKRLKAHKEKIAQEKREGLTKGQIDDRTTRYGQVKNRADEVAMGAPAVEASAEEEATRTATHEADGGEADAS